MGETVKGGRRTCLGLVSLVLCVFLFLSDESYGHVKLNVPRVRLPYFENLVVNFTLKVDTPGCYTWSLSRKDVVTITTATPSSSSSFSSGNGGDNGNDIDLEGFGGSTSSCSESAIISTIPRVTSCCPATAIIIAEDVVTKESIRCDVIVDRISSIQIFTTTKELHLEEAPSKFHIVGFGSKENELSTLDGVPFTWSLESAKQKETQTLVDPQSIMRFIPFSESPYEATSGIAKLEKRREQGNTVLLEGIKTGSAEVIARVKDPMYKGLETRVRIIVVASLLLEPNEIWIVPGTIVSISLWQIKQGKKFEIRLPSTVYVFSVENEKAAIFNADKSTMTGLEYGEAKLNVRDKNWVDELEEYAESLTTRVHVTEPKYLSLSVYPHKNWALVMGSTYEIQVDIYNVENQKIFIGDNVFVETTFDPKFFKVNYSSPNGTYHIGIPIRLGSCYVTAELKKIVLPDGTERLPSPAPRVKTEMEIFQNVAVNPKETVLPWDPNVKPKYDLRWNPSGGNGNYIWTSSNTSVVTVSSAATGRTEGFGSANVTVATSINPYMRSMARVYVLPPTKMEIVDHIVEAEVGTAIQVPLAFYTIRPNDPNKTEVPYSSCRELPIEVTVEDPNFVYDSKTHYPNLKPACVVLPIMGNTLGSSKVTATYSVLDKYFEDSVIVSTFKPLRTLEPEKDPSIVVLAVGSSKQIVFEGGPRPLLERYSSFQKSLQVENATVASYRELKPMTTAKDDVYVFEVLCREIGETAAIFRIGNTKASSESQSVVRIKVVRVICAEPAQMYFKVESPIKSKCPNDGSAAQVVMRVAVPNYESTLLSVVVKDQEGRKFDNITSLKFDWMSQPAYLDFITTNYAVTEGVLSPFGYIDTGKGLQTVQPKKVSGNVEVTGRVIGYRDEILHHYGLKRRTLPTMPKEEALDLEHSMDLTLVSDVTVSPLPPVSLFNHPSSKTTLRIVDGSGYYELDRTNAKNLNVTYNELMKSIEIKPLRQGKSTLILRDLCVPTRKETIIDVDVTGIGRIEVNSDDKIPVGGENYLTVSLLDHNGKMLPNEIIKLAQLSHRPVPFEILELHPLISTEKQKGAVITYKMLGKGVGTVNIIFMAEDGTLLSKPKTIDVFPPLQLHPKVLHILPGNLVQVKAHGGPSDADIVFTISPEVKNVITIQSADLTTGSIKALSVGRSIVYGRAIDPTTKKIYSEDFAEVRVVELTALKVVAPLAFLYENEKMPVWFKGVAGKTEITPELLATASPSLSTIEWIVSNLEHAIVYYVFESSSSTTRIGKDLRTQFHALKNGNISLQVRAYYRGELLSSQKMDLDIRQYPFGETSERVGPASFSWLQLLNILWDYFYYWLVLPTVVAIAGLIGTLTYNSYIYGTEKSTKGTSSDGSIFITSPVFSSSSPGTVRYTPAGASSSPMPSASSSYLASPPSSAGGGGDVSPASHRRLFSTGDSLGFRNARRSMPASTFNNMSPDLSR